MSKKVVSIFLSLVIAIGLITPASAASPTFYDVPASHWSYEHVEKAVSNGLVNGVGGGLYQPEREVTNAEWATMVCNLFYTAEVDDYRAFAERIGEPMAQWYEPYMVISNMNQIFFGTEASSNWTSEEFEAAVNRYDMAQVIYNLSSKQRWTFYVDATGASSSIADWNGIPEKYQTAVAFCYAAGFITGVDSQGTFSGNAVMTRGAAAVVLCRLLDAKNGEHDFGPGKAVADTDTPTAVADMITITETGTDASGYKTYAISLDVPAYNGTNLSNGKPITEENFKAMLAELEAFFPEGTSWAEHGAGDVYYYQGEAGCNSWAYMTRDLLFGKGSMAYSISHTDLSAVKTGDIVHLNKVGSGIPSHWIVITGTGTSITGNATFTICEGNSNSQVMWAGTNYVKATSEERPDSIVYTFY